jgi:hypothetical protein
MADEMTSATSVAIATANTAGRSHQLALRDPLI